MGSGASKQPPAAADGAKPNGTAGTSKQRPPAQGAPPQRPSADGEEDDESGEDGSGSEGDDDSGSEEEEDTSKRPRVARQGSQVPAPVVSAPAAPISPQDALMRLRVTALFRGCDGKHWAKIEKAAQTRTFSKGEDVLVKGDVGSGVYIVLEGTAEITTADHSTVFAVLGPGEYFGELSAVFGVACSATVRASSKLSCRVLPRDVLVREGVASKKETTDKQRMFAWCAERRY
eukprot:Opistho-1_new@53779